jgi:hypothetical protein
MGRSYQALAVGILAQELDLTADEVPELITGRLVID